MAETMKIYYWPMFGRAGALVRMCEEKGQPYEVISDFPQLASKCNAFGAASSTFAPPIVQDGDTLISQSAACAMYVGEKLGLNSGVPSASQALQHLSDQGDLVTECDKAYTAAAELAPGKAVVSLRGFINKRFAQWMTTISNSITGPFFYGDSPTYVDFYLTMSIDWLQAVYLKGLPIWDDAAFSKVMTVVDGIRALPSYSGYSGPLKTVREDFATLSPDVAALWPGVKILGAPISPNVCPSMMLVADNDLGELQPVDLMNGEHMQPEFLSINPWHQIPAMKDGEVTLGEGNAILRYLARQYQPTLYGDGDAIVQAQIDWVLDWASTNLYPMFADLVYPVMGFAAPKDDIEGLIKKVSENIDTFEKKFLTSAEGDAFAVGNALSIADYKSPTAKKYLESVFKASPKGKAFVEGGPGAFMKSKEEEGVPPEGTD